MVNFSVVLIFVYFVVAIFDLVHALKSVFHNFLKFEQHVEIFSVICVIPGKLQFAVAQASLIFPKRVPGAGSS